MGISVSSVPCPHSRPELFCTQLPILDPAEAQKLTQFFNGQAEKCYFRDVTNRRWGLKKEQSDFSLKERVDFNSEGLLVGGSVSNPYSSYQGFNLIQPIIYKALHQMAQKMGWKNESRSMAVTFMQHQIEYTLVCLLDDPDGEQMEWTGGEFQFRPETAKQGIFHSITPRIGQGILFSNQGTQHSVTPICPKLKRAQRTIMAIHDYGPLGENRKNTWQKIRDAFFRFFSSILSWTLTSVYSLQAWIVKKLS